MNDQNKLYDLEFHEGGGVSFVTKSGYGSFNTKEAALEYLIKNLVRKLEDRAEDLEDTLHSRMDRD